MLACRHFTPLVFLSRCIDDAERIVVESEHVCAREPCIPRATLTTESGRLGEKLDHTNNLIRFDIKRF